MRKRDDFREVFQLFYHCEGEELPIRDILGRQHQGKKTEPHYENLTENWCSRCLNARISKANEEQVEYLFLVTRYRNCSDKELDGKLLVVGYLHREKNPKAWERLSRTLRADVTKFDRKKAKSCGFFVGDEESHFVAAKQAYPLEGFQNARDLKWSCDAKKGKKIIRYLNRKSSRNILPQLRRRAEELKAKAGLPVAKRCEQRGARHGTCKK